MSERLSGLKGEEVVRSREKNGANVLKKEKRKGFFKRLLENLNDPIIKILIIALVIEVVFTFGNCNLIEVFGIVFAIFIASTVSTVSEMGSERAFLKMQSESTNTTVRVMRDGTISEIQSSEIVVGDIVYLSSGERVMADGELISGRVSIDQSALNGESREVSKYPIKGSEGWELSSRGKVFSGTLVTDGEAIMRVLRVGSETYYGMVAHDVQSETRESPLKLRLSHLAGQISKIGYIMAAIVAVVYLFNAIVVDNGFSLVEISAFFHNPKSIFSTLIHALTLVITVIVVAVPEGLPMMITVVLSANMKRMLRDKILVKKLVGIETAGSMNILFTDKTGTVTVGEPRIERIECQSCTYRSISALRRSPALHYALTHSAIYNTDAYFTGGKIIGGNGTDRAITDYFKSEKYDSYKIEKKERFSSDKKYSTVVLSSGRCYVKGAPEIILSRSAYALNEKGEIVPLKKIELEAKLHEASSRGNRVIAAAYKDKGMNDFVFIGLIVLKDMLRRDSRDAIEEIRRAGVRIVMLTGDGKDTASAIAEECGIIKNKETDLVLTSAELSVMSDEEVKEIIPVLSVLARALPQDKTRLVRLSQELELVVGMTGDGINDAPSLKLADVGFAMGSGAEIAKSAGDVVILDDSLFAINRTILYGRTIFKSIRKFIVFQLIMNLAACGVSILGQLLGVETPITIIQMLWVNIIMDTLGGLAFAGEPALSYYMKEKPKRRDEPILTVGMIKRILIMGSYTLLMCIVFLKSSFFRNMFSGESGEIRFLTAFYALFIFLGIFNSFTARCERMWVLSHIGKNKPFIFIMLLITVIQLFIIYRGGALFRAHPLMPNEIGMVILLALTTIPFDTARRILMKRETE